MATTKAGAQLTEWVGMFADSPEMLRKAADYIEKYRGTPDPQSGV
jgi:hypothetical protein